MRKGLAEEGLLSGGDYLVTGHDQALQGMTVHQMFLSFQKAFGCEALPLGEAVLWQLLPAINAVFTWV